MGMTNLNNESSKESSPNSLPFTSISFACGGWLQFYLYGCARAIQAQGIDNPDLTYLGCSAGALAACGIVFEGNFDDAVEFCKRECVPRAYGEFFGLFQIGEYVAKCLDLYLLPKFKPIPLGHLQVAVTRLPFLRGERVIDFPSSDHLKSALLASAAAFPAAPLVFRSGSWYVDGGLTDFQPVVDDTTLTISPFYFSDCDIKPSRYVPLWWAFLPPRSSDTVDWLYSLGFHDTMTYFAQKGIAETTRSRPQLRSVFKNPHPYDIPRRVSVNRFLGYDVGNLTHEYVSFLMDFVLLVLLVVVWRPAALLLIYVELWAQLTVELVSSLIAESYTTLPLSLFSFLMFQNWVVTGWVSALVCVEKVLIFGFSTVASKKLRNCGDYFSCIFSLSLMLRFLRPACPREVLRKHQRLAKISILYRVFCHMI